MSAVKFTPLFLGLLFLLGGGIILIILIKNPGNPRLNQITTFPKTQTEGCLLNRSYVSDLAGSVTLIYDFSITSKHQLKEHLEHIFLNINADLIRDVLIVNNGCQNEEALQYAANFVNARENRKLIKVTTDRDQVVSRGRIRAEAAAKAKGSYFFFVSHGATLGSAHFLSSLLAAIVKYPSRAVVPSMKGSKQVPHLTWSLNIEHRNAEFNGEIREVPLVDQNILLIRSDLYEVVGGYDKFFYHESLADRIGLSLNIWLCGGTVVQTKCAVYSANVPSKKTTFDLSYAKYIQTVYAGPVSHLIATPGIEHFHSSDIQNKLASERRSAMSVRRCLHLDWFARRFPAALEIRTERSRLYDPAYKPERPGDAQAGDPRFRGRLFILYAGQCVRRNDDDALLGMEWCPSPLKANHRFHMRNGQISHEEKCLGANSDGYIGVFDCSSVDKTQKFIYKKSTKQLQSDGRCITHVSGPNNRQMLQLTRCADAEDRGIAYQKFILEDNY